MEINRLPLVSIIIPVYGVEKYIEQCAASLFNQTYTNIEYIFVDDCGTDNSIKILREVLCRYKDRESQVTMIRNHKNLGLPQARKNGYEHCNGDYIIHIDSDDWIDNNYIEELVTVAKSTSSDIVWCDYIWEDQDKPIRYDNRFENLSKHELLKKMLDGDFHSGVWNKLVVKHLYDNIEFAEKGQLEDFFLTFQLFVKASSWASTHLTNYHYRINPESMTFLPERVFKRIDEEYSNFSQLVFMLERKGFDFKSLNPNFAYRFNALKVAKLKYKETRNIRQIKKEHPETVDYVMQQSMPLKGKLLLWSVTRFNSNIPIYIYDLLKK